MAQAHLVIVGGGLASAKTVQSYREGGGDDRVTLISADSFVPYHRPPLSKRYLRGEIEADGTFVAPEDFYREQDVELRLETRVERVLPGERALELSGGERVPYDRLVVATGGTPRRLGVPGEESGRVFVLRTLADSTAIREAAESAGRAVVVGGSFIGSEVTASLRTLGVEVAQPLVPPHPTLGAVDSVESLKAYQDAKRAHTAQLRAAEATAKP